MITAYEKQNWVCGDTLTADKLNHMEQGIEDASQSGGGVLVVNDNDGTLDKTFKEISDAYFAGQVVKVIAPSGAGVVWDILEPNTMKLMIGLYQVQANLGNAQIVLGSSYTATDEDSYPSKVS